MTSNTNNELVMSSSTARNDASKISTWDGLVDMDVEEALVRTSTPSLAHSSNGEACAYED